MSTVKRKNPAKALPAKATGANKAEKVNARATTKGNKRKAPLEEEVAAAPPAVAVSKKPKRGIPAAAEQVKGKKTGSKSQGGASAEAKAGGEPHPFKWDPADDCETSIQAYRDITPVLKKLAHKLGKQPVELRIYDPYYCQGGVEKNLNKLGFENVYNKNEDFYARLDSGKLPPHDVLMTSPPYSGDHIKRLVEHCSKSTTPWIFLMPDYVHRKLYYQPLLNKCNPFFLIPAKPYKYLAVSGSRSDNTHVPCRHFQRSGKCPKGGACMFVHDASAVFAAPSTKTGVNENPTPTTPFSSIWHIHLGEGKLAAEPVMQWWSHKFGKQSSNRMVRSVKELPASRA